MVTVLPSQATWGVFNTCGCLRADMRWHRQLGAPVCELCAGACSSAETGLQVNRVGFSIFLFCFLFVCLFFVFVFFFFFWPCYAVAWCGISVPRPGIWATVVKALNPNYWITRELPLNHLFLTLAFRAFLKPASGKSGFCCQKYNPPST